MLRNGEFSSYQRHSGGFEIFLQIRYVDLVSFTEDENLFCVYVGKSAQVSWRLEQLKNLLKMLDENESLLCEALYKDLRKPKQVAGIICSDRVASYWFAGEHQL